MNNKIFSEPPFNLNKGEVKLAYKANNIMLSTNWCKDGKMQEKGERAEQLVLQLLSLCEVEVLQSNRSSVLDEVLKVDILLKNKDEIGDVFAFQVKCSETGASKHHDGYKEGFNYEGYYFRTPWCLIVNDTRNSSELFNELIEELCLTCLLDFPKIELIASKVIFSAAKRINKDNFDLTKKELTALRLLHNIGSNKKTLFLK